MGGRKRDGKKIVDGGIVGMRRREGKKIGDGEGEL